MIWKAPLSGGVTSQGAELLKGLNYIISSMTTLIVGQTSILQFNKQ